MNAKELQTIFTGFNRLKVLIVGDVILDSYMWGKVSRISPEAPVPIVAVDKKEKRLGGAANVALNIQAMGAAPILCSVIGADTEGDEFLALLKKQKLSSEGILRSNERITTVKTRIIGNNHQMLRIDEEQDNSVGRKETVQLSERIAAIVTKEKIDVIIFEDYDKGIITAGLIKEVTEMAGRKKVPTVVDPKKRNFHHYRNITLFKPNLKELKDGLKADFDPSDMASFKKAVDVLCAQQNIETALITLSEHGVYVSNKKIKKVIPAHLRRVADVSGAGDTVVSVAALCCALGLPADLTASMANLAGGLVCERVGVVPIDKKQLLAEVLRLGITA